MNATRNKPSKLEIESIAAVLRDPSRSDRYLTRDDSGHLYTTPDVRFIGHHRPLTTNPYIRIPGDYKLTKSAARDWARGLVRDLDEAASTWTG